MKRTIGVETDDIDSTTEIERLTENTLRRISNHKIETSPSVSVTSEEVARQIKAVTRPLSQQLAHLYELMRELRNEQMNKRDEETASSRVASSLSVSGSRSDGIYVCMSVFIICYSLLTGKNSSEPLF